ncbi:hypothetical protein IA02_11530 [Flavobacterium psychrophilum]|nr:hypothetical protein IA02_11530 [Flavobacterium psychrophilum]
MPKTLIAPNRCACCTTKNKIQNQLFLCVLILITTVNQLVKNIETTSCAAATAVGRSLFYFALVFLISNSFKFNLLNLEVI